MAPNFSKKNLSGIQVRSPISQFLCSISSSCSHSPTIEIILSGQSSWKNQGQSWLRIYFKTNLSGVSQSWLWDAAQSCPSCLTFPMHTQFITAAATLVPAGLWYLQIWILRDFFMRQLLAFSFRVSWVYWSGPKWSLDLPIVGIWNVVAICGVCKYLLLFWNDVMGCSIGV